MARKIRLIKKADKRFDEILIYLDGKFGPVRISEKPDVNALSGIWNDHPVALKDLRKQDGRDRI